MNPTNSSTQPADNVTLFLVGVDARVRSLLLSLNVPVQDYSDIQQLLNSADLSQPGCVVSELSVTAPVSGIGLLRELRRRALDIAVVLISRVPDMSLAVEAMSEGATTMLAATCDAQQLFDAVHRGLQENRIRRLSGQEKREFISLLSRLSDNETQVLKHIVAGRHNKEIAAELQVSVRTVENWRKSGLEKMQIDSSLELVRKLMRAGFRDWPDDISPG